MPWPQCQKESNSMRLPDVSQDPPCDLSLAGEKNTTAILKYESHSHVLLRNGPFHEIDAKYCIDRLA